jgi:hypothetical protein
MKLDLNDCISQGNAEMKTLISALDDKFTKFQAEQDTQSETINALKLENRMLTERSKITDGRITRLEQIVGDLLEEMLLLQQHSMRENIIFQNINEVANENVALVLQNFLEKELRMPTHIMKTVQIVRCHRMGQKGRYARAIVAKVNEAGKQAILSHTYNLKNTDYRVNVQMPRELDERKKRLLPQYQDAKTKGITTRWIGHKLQVGTATIEVKRDSVKDINVDTTENAIQMKVGRSPPIETSVDQRCQYKPRRHNPGPPRNICRHQNSASIAQYICL